MNRSEQLARSATPLAIAGITAVTVLGVWFTLAGRGPFTIDRAAHAFVSVTPGTPMYAVAVSLAEIGSGIGGAACFAIATAALFALRRHSDALAVAFTGGLGVLLSELMKALIARPRPADALVGVSGFSFPSGHSMGAAALACSIFLVVYGWPGLSRRIVRGTAIAGCCWALLMMWSRIALNAHWLSDTVGGALLGLCVAILSYRLWHRRPPHSAKRPV